MCGFAGGNSSNWNYNDAIESIIYRGPDGNKVEQYEGMTLAFCRLAIQDLSSAAMQPMSGAEGKVHIVFNGEIYGYHILRKQLSEKYKFHTTSDTEVILNAYLEYGIDFIGKIDGIFAIAIYDERVKKVYLFRDRVGVKPLYYYYNGRDFAFASEIKAIEALLKNDTLIVDNTALYDSLFYLYVPEPKTMYKNVYKLRPATMIAFDVYQNKIVNQERYWNLKVSDKVQRKKSKEEVSDEIRFLIGESVKKQLISDVPVGTFLSGGVDSSIITYEAHQINQDIYAYSIGFEEAQYDESKRAKMFCNKENIPLRQRILHNTDIKEIKPMIKEWYTEPFGDTSAYPCYLVSKFAKGECTVVLTGDGGDELFGGYDRYRYLAFKGEELTKEDIYLQFAPVQSAVEDLKIRWNIPKDYSPYWHFDEYINEELPIVNCLRYLDFMTYLPEDILTKIDRVSMAVSLEARVPFLAKEIIEYAFMLSEEEYLSAGQLKGCLKDAYTSIIPNEILYGVKMGFSIPGNYLWRENHEKNIFAGIIKTQWNDIYRMNFQ